MVGVLGGLQSHFLAILAIFDIGPHLQSAEMQLTPGFFVHMTGTHARYWQNIESRWCGIWLRRYGVQGVRATTVPEIRPRQNLKNSLHTKTLYVREHIKCRILSGTFFSRMKIFFVVRFCPRQIQVAQSQHWSTPTERGNAIDTGILRAHDEYT